MRILPVAIATFFALMSHASASEPVRLGISAPLSGPYAILGRQIVQGAQAAANALGGDTNVLIFTADDRCDEDGGKEAAASLRRENVQVVIGYLCTPSLMAAMPEFRQSKALMITLGVRAERMLKDATNNGDALIRFSPNARSEAEAIASLLLPLWRGKNFAIVDDGTINAREIAESLRLAAEIQGLKPAFIDSFRPASDNQVALVTRLRQSGATHVFVGGDRDDIAILARDAAARGLDLVIAGGEALASAAGEVPLADGVLMVGLPATGRVKPTAGSIEGYALPAQAITEIIVQSGRQTGPELFDAIRGARYQTVLGEVGFDANGELAGNPYRLFVSKSDSFEEYQ